MHSNHHQANIPLPHLVETALCSSLTGVPSNNDIQHAHATTGIWTGQDRTTQRARTISQVSLSDMFTTYCNNEPLLHAALRRSSMRPGTTVIFFWATTSRPFSSSVLQIRIIILT